MDAPGVGALMLRFRADSIGRGRRPALAAWLAVAAILVFAGPAHAQISYWSPWNSEVLATGPLQVRLAFVDTNGAAQNLALPQLSQPVSDALPSGLKEVRQSPLLQTQGGAGYFDRVWSSVRAAVCSEVRAEIVNEVNFSPNSAYNVTCQTNPKGALSVAYVTNWQNDQFQRVYGRRLVMDFWVPLNAATFYVTSPYTCHAGPGCGVQPTDPQYTVTFSAHVTVVATSADPSNFSLPLTSTATASIIKDGITGGDITGTLTKATVQWAASLPVAAAAAAARKSVV